MATSGGKASFIDLEAGYGTFAVQYNPKEFKVDKAVSWKEHDDQGQTNAGLEFQKGAPMSVSMDLYFDTTSDSNSDVRTKWVNGLLCLTNAKVKPSEGSTDKKRPPKVKFTWGSFEVTCVIESINVQYLMFSSDGTPVRARCSVKMKEWDPGEVDAGGGGDYITGDKVKLVTAGAGATASSVAAENDTTAKKVMEDNDLEDGTEIPAGTELAITDPKSETTNVTSNRPAKDESKSPWQEITDALKEAEKVAGQLGKTKDSVEKALGGGSSKDSKKGGGRSERPSRSGGKSERGGSGKGGKGSKGGRTPPSKSGGGKGGKGGKGAKGGRGSKPSSPTGGKRGGR
ncbi:MAG: hypothetical protein GY913_34325 [Proteobacteria bacterium]|nr:hypothetical protein [Pseudomonadota bacterium]